MSRATSTATAERYEWGDGCLGWRLVTKGEFAVIEEMMPPGAVERWHYHAKAQQFFYVLAGELTITTKDRSYTIQPTSGFEVTSGDPHRVENQTCEVAKFLVISVPPSHQDRINAEQVIQNAP